MCIQPKSILKQHQDYLVLSSLPQLASIRKFVFGIAPLMALCLPSHSWNYQSWTDLSRSWRTSQVSMRLISSMTKPSPSSSSQSVRFNIQAKTKHNSQLWKAQSSIKCILTASSSVMLADFSLVTLVEGSQCGMSHCVNRESSLRTISKSLIRSSMVIRSTLSLSCLTLRTSFSSSPVITAPV